MNEIVKDNEINNSNSNSNDKTLNSSNDEVYVNYFYQIYFQ